MTGKQRGPYMNSQRRRTRIIAAAAKAIGENGFRHLSMRQLADEIGISHTTLLRYFGSKDGLLQAVLEQREEGERDWRSELIEQRGLLAALPEVLAHNMTMPAIIRLDTTLTLEAIDAEHPAHDFVRQREEDFQESLCIELLREQRVGRLSNDVDAEQLAHEIRALVEGLQLLWLNDPSLDIAETIRDFIQHVTAS